MKKRTDRPPSPLPTGDGPPNRGRGPRRLGDTLGDLFAAKGYGRLRSRGELEAAWEAAVGEDGRGTTRVEGVRHGVLTIAVAHHALLEELAAFRKAGLLAALRRELPDVRLLDIRFRFGAVGPPET